MWALVDFTSSYLHWGKKWWELVFFNHRWLRSLSLLCICVVFNSLVGVYFFLCLSQVQWTFAVFPYLLDVYCIVLFLSLTFIFLNGDCCLVHEVWAIYFSWVFYLEKYKSVKLPVPVCLWPVLFYFCGKRFVIVTLPNEPYFSGC